MSDFLQHLQVLQEQPITMVKPIPEASEYIGPPQNIMILDLSKDPDPYGLHNMPLSYRLKQMGWS